MLIRLIVRLLYEGLREEAARLVARLRPSPPPPPPTSPAAKEVPPPETSLSVTANYHALVIRSDVCPDCQGPKQIGAYRCMRCIERLRKEHGI